MCCSYHDDFIMCVIRDFEGVDEHLNRFISYDMCGKFFTLGLSDWLVWNFSFITLTILTLIGQLSLQSSLGDLGETIPYLFLKKKNEAPKY